MKDNKIIAEFMGWETHPKYGNECLQNNDWSWLMPVVEKIEEMGFTTAIKTNYVRVNPKENASYYNYISYVAFNENGWYANPPAPTYDSELNHPPIDRGDKKITKLKATYKAVTQFIEWYNENNKI